VSIQSLVCLQKMAKNILVSSGNVFSQISIGTAAQIICTSLGGDHTIVRITVSLSDLLHSEHLLPGAAHLALVAQGVWSYLCDTLRCPSGL
jgi:hypothetical protein